VIQRFGGALNLNVHIHALVLDGVFARDAAGVVAFHPARRGLLERDLAGSRGCVTASRPPRRVRIRSLIDGLQPSVDVPEVCLSGHLDPVGCPRPA
jgi:hypothetical protein